MNRLALFSSFIPSAQPRVPKYIFYYLKQMRPHAKTLVYLYNDDFTLNTEDEGLLREIVDDIMPVKNEGYDFGMWQKGLRKHNAHDYDELCLFNDSCVCVGSLDSFFEWHNQRNLDMTGLTTSADFAPHLQSYFLCFKKSGIEIATSWLADQNFSALNFKQIVVTGEMGLSLYARFNGKKINGYFAPIEHYDISMKFARELISQNSPLVKKKALLKDVQENTKILIQQNGEKLDFLTDFIKQHRQLSEERCHELFGWLPIYQIDGKLYQGK